MIRPRAMKRPASTIKKLGPWKVYCDWLWARIIKARAGHVCEICGQVHRVDGGIRQIHAHHLIDREVLVYRHDLMNGICLCASCHKTDKHRAAHRNPRVFDSELSRLACFLNDTRVFTEEDRGLIVARRDWHNKHYCTGPINAEGGTDLLKPKSKDYPGIVDRLEQEMEKYA